MSFRVFAIGLGIVTFLLTFALQSWHEGLWRGRSAPAAVLSAVRAPAIVPGPFPALRAATVSAPATAPALSRFAAPPSRAVQAPSEPASSDATEVPVTVVVDSASDNSGNIIGDIVSFQNISIEPLNLTITRVRPSTGEQSTVAVTIPAGKRIFALDAGLLIHPGDQITVKSPSYSDQVVQLD